ncbi:calcium-binding protein [Tropicimonas marinistellae]|uniref:calcium-binding protein n=1 Tax=Tropicimonas marinistellae TaxID=1739787 RepID=UPI000829C71A|nr:calcium-binding protein [Tropicimonas marinistellae]
MAIWKYYEANKGIHGFRWDTEYYDINPKSNKIVLTYNESLGRSFEDDRNAYRIEFLTKGAKTYKPEEGPNKGEDQYYAGSVTEIRMFDATGNLQIKVTNIDVPLVAMQGWYNREEDFDRVFTFLDSFKSTHMGSDNGKPKTWDLELSWDDIRTGRGNDTVNANGGHDFIQDMGGKDSYNGGAGYDQLSYEEWYYNPDGAVSGIKADLKAGTIVGPDGAKDSVKGIEGVRGTFLKDVIRGDGKDNTMVGFAGNDVLDGRGGWDRLRYDRDDDQGGYAGIRADMKKGKIKDGFGTTDTIKSIERVDGSDERDVFIDSGKDHGFRGRDGNDLFRIYGGNDWMNGDEGADTFKFYGDSFGSDYVGDYNAGDGDSLTIMAATKKSDLKILSRDGGNDTLVRLNKNAEVYLEDVNPGSVDAGDFIA